MPAPDPPRPPALPAALVLAAGLALVVSWGLLGGTLAELLLAAVVGGALVVLYGLRRYARARLVYPPGPGERAPAPGAEDSTARTGV